MRVVIVEDQTMIRSLLESYFLAEDGNQIVASIPGAKQAVEVCRASPVDLVLMDVQTEHRENGLVAVRQIKAERPQIKIVVVTSLLDGAVLEEAKSASQRRWAARCRRSNSMWRICCRKPDWKTSFSLRWQSATPSWSPICRKSNGVCRAACPALHFPARPRQARDSRARAVGAILYI